MLAHLLLYSYFKCRLRELKNCYFTDYPSTLPSVRLSVCLLVMSVSLFSMTSLLCHFVLVLLCRKNLNTRLRKSARIYKFLQNILFTMCFPLSNEAWIQQKKKTEANSLDELLFEPVSTSFSQIPCHVLTHSVRQSLGGVTILFCMY